MVKDLWAVEGVHVVEQSNMRIVLPGIYRKLVVHMGLLETAPKLMSKRIPGESSARLQDCVGHDCISNNKY